jgi:aconitate hydratase
MLGAGLVARNAVKLGLKVKPWVKTSLAPGSRVVTDYLEKAGVQKDLNKLGFNLVGYGCTTCIGNSGPLPEPIAEAITAGDLVACSVLSGNRNFEGRVSPHARANYLASPMLVVAYALAGNMNIDLTKEPLGTDKKGKPVYLKDIWPTNAEIHKTIKKSLKAKMFRDQYGKATDGDSNWKKIKTGGGLTYKWDKNSTYVKHPPYFQDMQAQPAAVKDVIGARALAVLGDSITTDHISPAGSIKKNGPAGEYLMSHKVTAADFNSYGARRGNHEVMMRGTFANIRLRNEMVPGTEGGVTMHLPAEKQMSIYDASMLYQEKNIPLVIVAGKEYGTGSSRDWAAKGTVLLGIRAVIAESFERIHRSNLVGMGVLPLVFKNGESRKSHNLTGREIFDIKGVEKGIKPRMDVTATVTYPDGKKKDIVLTCRIDTEDEVNYYRNGGILHYVLRNLINEAAA